MSRRGSGWEWCWLLPLCVACSEDNSSNDAALSDAGSPARRMPRPGNAAAEPEPAASAGSGGSGGRAPTPRPSRPRNDGGSTSGGEGGAGASAGEGPAPEPEPTAEPEPTPSAGGRGGGDGRDAGGRDDAGVTPAPEPEPVEPEPTPVGEPVAVAVGYGMRRVSSSNGVDWEHFAELTPDGGDDNDLFRGLTFGGGRFVAVGGSSMSISLVSTDGETWTAEDRAQGAWMGGVAFLDGEFVVAGGNGLRVHSEDLGESWLDPAGYQAIHYRDVTVGDGTVVAVGHTYNESPDVGIIAFTRDGRSWTEVGHNGSNLSRVAYGRGVFVAAGADGRVSTSPDGENWQDATVGSGGGSIVFVNGHFALSNGDGVFVSDDGSDWDPVAGSSYGIEGFVAGYYLALGWPAVIRASADMVEWQTAFDPGGSGFTRIVTGYIE